MNEKKCPTFDLDAVIEQTGLDLEDYLEIYELFQENFEELMTEIQDALNVKDVDRIMRGAHTMKGSTSNIGFIDLADLAKEMQENPDDFDLVTRCMPELRRIYEVLNEQVQSLAGAAP